MSLINGALAGQTENLTELENLNEDTLLRELQARYNKDTIYTYVGEILVAVNPFKTVAGLYDDAQSKRYTEVGDRSSVPPHVFAVADTAYYNMLNSQPGPVANQVCVISGESGAGKTESAKLFMKHIIYLSGRTTGHGAHGLEEKIIQLNPLLESWGNAQTLMNDNSSRFGKFVILRFNAAHQIEGAIMSDYLLEKSRVVSQGSGERNFHVFYLFFSNISDAEKELYQVADPGEHRIICDNDDAIASIETKEMREMQRELMDCIKVVGFTDEQQRDMWSVLAGVLHTGDIEFGGDEQAYVINKDSVMARSTAQLGLVLEGLEIALTKSTNITRGEMIERAYKPEQSEDVRDAMAKALYGRCFRWIVNQVNLLLGPKRAKMIATDKFIGILDIFGFECFDVNSFEQLLINLANERLQQFFNDHIFKSELDEYAKEGIDGSKITFEDNSDVIDMFMARPLGLIAITDEEGVIPKSTDTTLVEKLHEKFSGRKGYERPKGNDVKFSIIHYAGKVTYEAAGFLDKNKDTLPADLIGALRLSDNILVRHLFQGDDEDAKAAKKGKAKRDAANAKKNLRKSMKKAREQQKKAKKTTVGTDFKESLVKLMDEMSQASPHFIRCIKPNHEKLPSLYNEELVTKQLRYCGMLETTRIRKEGYSYRPLFKDFVERYKVLGYPFSSNPPATAPTCARILEKINLQGWQVGKTKVFMRYYHQDELNEKFRPFPEAAVKLTKLARGFVARNEVRKLKAVAAKEAKAVEDMFRRAERNVDDMHSVMLSIIDEDNNRPADYFTKKQEKPKPSEYTDPAMKKIAKKAQGKKGFTRAASVKWFREVEMKKGAGVSSAGKFEEWFHGVISRHRSEELLAPKEPGTFLVRVAESRFGYSLSHNVGTNKRIKHYMINQTPDGQYQVVGNHKLFPSLNELVQYHNTHKIVSEDTVYLQYPCGQEVGEEDDRAELVGKKNLNML